MSYDARAVANFLLDYCDSKDGGLSVMAVLKIIYYAHGWHLAKFGEPLVQQSFEAWEYGPVVRSVWESFRGAGSRAINSRAQKLNVFTNSREVVKEDFSPETAEFIRQICDAYRHFEASELSKMTHEKGTPWDAVWNRGDGRVNLGMQISNDVIRNWFAGVHATGVVH